MFRIKSNILTINSASLAATLITINIALLSYIAVHLKCDPGVAETISFVLQEDGYDGTSYENDMLVAYTNPNHFNKERLLALVQPFKVEIEGVRTEQDQNWNQVWEDNFKESFIGKNIHVRAPFHPAASLKHEIIIHPKMAFGTGHHATTQLSALALEQLDCTNKDVLDMGCGSGILAILASQKGANAVLAIDYDINSVNNSTENVQLNEVRNVKVMQADNVTHLTDKFDIILSNIIKSINLKLLPDLVKKLRPDGHLVISGFLVEDENELVAAAEACNLTLINKHDQDNWLQATFKA